MKYCWSAAVLFFAAALSFFSCSLKYDDAVDAEKNTPEFIFNEAKLVRYKDGNEEVRVQAQNIEQYKNSSITYGKNVKFMTYDKDHKLETEGSCGYLFAESFGSESVAPGEVHPNVIGGVFGFFRGLLH